MSDNRKPTPREQLERKCLRRVSAVARILKEARASIQAAKRDEAIMGISDAVVELVVLGDLLEENIMEHVFDKLKKLDRLAYPSPEDLPNVEDQ